MQVRDPTNHPTVLVGSVVLTKAQDLSGRGVLAALYLSLVRHMVNDPFLPLHLNNEPFLIFGG